MLFLLSLWQWEGTKSFDLYPRFSPYPEAQPGVASPWDTTPPAPVLLLCPGSWGHFRYLKQGAARSRHPGLRTGPSASPGRLRAGIHPGMPYPDPLLSRAWLRSSPLSKRAFRPREALQDQAMELGEFLCSDLFAVGAQLTLNPPRWEIWDGGELVDLTVASVPSFFALPLPSCPPAGFAGCVLHVHQFGYWELALGLCACKLWEAAPFPPPPPRYGRHGRSGEFRSPFQASPGRL